MCFLKPPERQSVILELQHGSQKSLKVCLGPSPDPVCFLDRTQNPPKRDFTDKHHTYSMFTGSKKEHFRPPVWTHTCEKTCLKAISIFSYFSIITCKGKVEKLAPKGHPEFDLKSCL